MSYEPVIPAGIRDTLVRYRDQHLEPGGFTRSLLENDLVRTISSADNTSRVYLSQIIMWCMYNLPNNSWGSPDKVDKWLSQKLGPESLVT